MYFESHAHYDDSRFNDDRNELLSKTLKKSGVSHVVNAGADMKSSRIGIELSSKYDFVYSAVGVHPHEVKNMTENDMAELTKMTENKKVVAIGEIGLDYYYDHSPRELQKYWFEKQLELALAVDLPVIIHSRDACNDTMEILRNWNKTVSPLLQISKNRLGVVHSYSGKCENALELIKMGFYIGVGGVVTFKNAIKAVEVVAEIPLENILIETDCPYLSPTPKRGERNDSQNLKYIVEKIAQIKQVSENLVASVTKENAMSLFKIN